MRYFILVLFFFASAKATANRITPDMMIRCKAGVTQEKCERQRQNALAKSCITQVEFDSLKQLGGMPTCFEEDASFMGWCPCGCFAADTTVKVDVFNLTLEETVKNVIDQFVRGQRPEVAHLSSGSTLRNIQLKASPLLNVSVGTEDIPLVSIVTKSAGSKGRIDLTTNHPVVLADGSITRAENLKAGQKLLNYLGKAETIKAVSRKPYNGLVYNFNVNTPVDSEHLVVANGFLMGDLYLQGSLSYFENQILVRR